MEIAINKCYGGFSLSHEAIRRLYDMPNRCSHVKLITPQEYYGEFWQEYLAKDKAIKLSYVTFKDDNILVDEHNGPDNLERSCPNLIQVIKELGGKANGHYAELKIIDCPVVEFEIDDYNGIESIHEKHRSWY